MIEVTSKQYSALILLGFLFMGVNGILVYKLLTNQVEFDVTCPVPKDKIKFCECFNNAYDGSLRHCICYAGDKELEELGLLEGLNLSINGTGRYP